MVAQYFADVTFWSSLSRARWPFLEANIPVVVSLIGPFVVPIIIPLLTPLDDFLTHGIDESVKASQVSATEEKCKK